MAFKIRDKTIFWTRTGWKNNWAPKNANPGRQMNYLKTVSISERNDYNTFLRFTQNYRNFSRTLKQYLYGNKEAEQAIIQELKTTFFLPFNFETPVQLIKAGGERRLVDQMDRDYELMGHNYHPAQLYIYDRINEDMRSLAEEQAAQEKGEQTIDTIFQSEFRREMQEEQARLPPGEKVSLEKVTEIFQKLIRVARAHSRQHSITRDKTGEFNDFLEKRRPFLKPNPLYVSH